MSSPESDCLKKNSSDDPLPQLTSSSLSHEYLSRHTSGGSSLVDCHTPTSDPSTVALTPTTEETNQWNTFYTRVEISPFKKINMRFPQVVEKANHILRHSGLTQPRNGSRYDWDSLSAKQQAGMAFIINEGILDHFPMAIDKNKWVAHCVLQVPLKAKNGQMILDGKAAFKNLYQFIRKGGDEMTVAGDSNSNYGGQKLSIFSLRYDDWGDRLRRGWKRCTMFELNPHIKPVLKYQTDVSMVCAFVVSSLMIYYRHVISSREPTTPAPRRWWRPQARDRSSNPDGTHAVSVSAIDSEIETRVGVFLLNIGRYMRQNLNAKEKYETIFRGGGFRFEDVMMRLLRFANPGLQCENAIRRIHLFERSPRATYDEIKEALEHGALCCRIRIYDGYEATDRCVMKPRMRFYDAYHFVTIIGVALTAGEHGGMMFLAQDSLYKERTFKSISLELVKAMESTDHLDAFFISKPIKMPIDTLLHFDTDPHHIFTAGGSFQIKKSDFCRDPPTDAEKAAQKAAAKQRLEDWAAGYDPNWIPQWARELRNDAANNNTAKELTYPTDESVEVVGKTDTA